MTTENSGPPIRSLFSLIFDLFAHIFQLFGPTENRRCPTIPLVLLSPRFFIQTNEMSTDTFFQ